MPLRPERGVPYVLVGEVLGLDNTKCWPVLAEPRDRLGLWVACGDMACAQFDAKGVRELRLLLEEVEALMCAETQDTVPMQLDTVPMELDDKPR